MAEDIVISCPICEQVIKTEEKASFVREEGDIELNEKYILTECLSCRHILLGKKRWFMDTFESGWYHNTETLWPSNSDSRDFSSFPEKVKRDLLDAQKCFNNSIYSATAVLCGRALERLVKEKAGNYTLYQGLQILKENAIIDNLLFIWAEALRVERNIGAHASEYEVSKEDAQDIIDFTWAIFDYVYRLSDKYQRYMIRKNSN